MGLVTTTHNSSSSKKPQTSSKVSQPNPDAQLKLNQSYGHIPLYFEPNEGQTDPQVKFISRGSGYTLFITPAEAVFVLKRGEEKFSPQGPRDIAKNFGHQPRTPNPPDVLRLRLEGGNRLAEFEGMEKAEGKSNYFIGNDPTKWHTNIANYTKVKMKDVYPGIDMVYYGAQRRLEYDFEVKPGADPSVIGLSYEGAKNAEVDGQGNLVFHMAQGDVAFKAPVVYQEQRMGNNKIDGAYKIRADGKIGFEMGNYDKTLPLVIDPVLDYSTYLGGSSSEDGRGITVDSSGNAYITGNTFSVDFPTTNGAYQTLPPTNGILCVFVSKLNSYGNALVYSTYLEGTGNSQGDRIALDSSDNAYISGYAGPNFPTTIGAYQTNFPGGIFNIFISKLNASGNNLLYSTYFGTCTYQAEGDAIAVDGSGNAYITGYTDGLIPTTPGAYQATPRVIFVAKINPGGGGVNDLIFSTYLGGSYDDKGYGIAVDIFGNTYVTGYTNTNNFPATSGAYQTTPASGFVSKLNVDGSILEYSTFLGCTAEAIAVNSVGNAYIVGYTVTGYPTTSGAFQTADAGNGLYGQQNVVMTELDPTGSTLIYSTYLGGSWMDYGFGIALDMSGYVYLTGGTASTDFPITSDAYETNNCGASAFVAILNPVGMGASDLIYSTYLCGDIYDTYGRTIAVDNSKNVYVVGSTLSEVFPTTIGAFQTINNGSYDAFVTKFSQSPSSITKCNT